MSSNNEVVRRAHTINLYVSEQGLCSGTVTLSNQYFDQAKSYMVNSDTPEIEYVPLISANPFIVSFTDPDGEVHELDLNPHLVEIDALLDKVESLKKPTHTNIQVGKRQFDQWHLAPEHHLIVVSPTYSGRLSASLYREVGNKEPPMQKFLISLWKTQATGSKKGTRFSK